MDPTSFDMQVMCMYITGHVDIIFPPEHKKEILRYIYSHQVGLCGKGKS